MIAIFGPNRVLDRIEDLRDKLNRGVQNDGVTPITADLVEFERTLDNDFETHFRFQTLQSEAAAMGKLNTNEAMTIYTALGEVPAADGWAEGTDLATKVIVTQIMGELITWRRKLR